MGPTYAKRLHRRRPPRQVVEVATKGSHVQFKHPEKPGRVTVPHPKRDIPIGTLKSIEKQAGLKLR
ncbi:type II toxin-antitoxin system HicA family toxin [Ensifer sp. ENS11]|nr:type II toxin-antitoxin system HicA family toxin [Ensifer sp. ENS11]